MRPTHGWHPPQLLSPSHPAPTPRPSPRRASPPPQGTDYAYERKRERKALQQTPQQYMGVPGEYVPPSAVYSDPASNLPNFGTVTPTFRGTEPPGKKAIEGGHLSWGDEELSSSGSDRGARRHPHPHLQTAP